MAGTPIIPLRLCNVPLGGEHAGKGRSVLEQPVAVVRGRGWVRPVPLRLQGDDVYARTFGVLLVPVADTCRLL